VLIWAECFWPRIGGIEASAAQLATSLLRDGHAVTAVEAAQMARPVIAARVGGLPENIVDRETGLLVPPGDAVILSAAIVRLLEQPHEAQRLGAAARTRAIDAFGQQRYVAAYTALYRRLAGAAGAQ
jgi:glycosyltransferase involved in cell wall biosynthesis